MSQSDANSTTKKKQTLGRRRIEMKKIEKKSSLRVTFTKRRTGLFKKASELALLCGAQIAILVQSPAADVPPPPPPSRSGYEEAVRQLEREKRRLERKEGESWWYEGMELHELEEYLEALLVLADDVSVRAGELEGD